MIDSKYKLLSRINSPQDLKKLDIAELPAVCEELRSYIIEVISHNAGHLGSSLGVVELTVAIHYVFDTPYDNLVWDVGHQAYPHKILTGRRDTFDTIRQFKGISGFPKTTESEYDAFGTGHASTSISAALGMAIAAKNNKEYDKNSIAVIGDGSISGGLAFEAMNNAGSSDANLLIILNDNGIAIDESVGAIKNYLLHIATSKSYNHLRDKLWNIFYRSKDSKGFIARQIKRNLKSSILDESNIFESLGLRYFGPADGHDVIELVSILSRIKEINGPKIFHCITTKGKGFPAAEENKIIFHAPGRFDAATGKRLPVTKGLPPKYQTVFGETITDIAKTNDKIIGITPAMPSGSSLNIMMEAFPERTFDVGISEEHAVTFAAGLAARGFRPYVAIYSTFLQRAYDQVVHDVALQNLPVVFCIDRAGLVGEDGPTHHGTLDLAFLRSIPNMIISAPIDEYELQNLIYTAQFTKEPFAIRYPRSRGVHKIQRTKYQLMDIGKAQTICEGNDVAVISIGHVGNFVKKAIAKLKTETTVSPAHYSMTFLKPLDEDLLHHVCKNFKYILTVEDGTIVGGLGSAVLEFISDNGYNCKLKRLGIPDKFIEHGTLNQLYELCGIDPDSIADEINKLYNNM
ncbi:MAG: 1-deoxy-D-xylulose-5-phosphate synthase [Bacteroidales bacterium]|jgi:1-deoxy-D-xylulose-5-phosphate synthase|nr:1-deoxy-D-xylulose-5-phosphate synthase [Bacteroidales bacterium]MDD3913214.1 1-deoxy-D-xylulose-5-phosphate synthase [Bacteroidales bacterium]MDD4633129.1 1-deoxy-D-xylulose-5-phosphate synthase [Bacteroidales bacterium]